MTEHKYLLRWTPDEGQVLEMGVVFDSARNVEGPTAKDYEQVFDATLVNSIYKFKLEHSDFVGVMRLENLQTGDVREIKSQAADIDPWWVVRTLKGSK